jgi:tryptophan 2,3-dioxygenase
MNIKEKLNEALERINAMTPLELQELIDKLNDQPSEITKSYARIERILIGEENDK